MVKSASFLLLYPIPQGRAYIYKNVCNHFYIPIYFLVIATSPNHISFTLTLMEPEVRFELTKLARRLTKPFQLTTMVFRLIQWRRREDSNPDRLSPTHDFQGQAVTITVRRHIMCGDQPSLRTWRHLTFTAPTIQRSAVEALDAPLHICMAPAVCADHTQALQLLTL